MDAILQLLNNDYFVFCAMSGAIFGLSQAIKIPIKHFTSRINDANVRKRVNATILLVPFMLGVLAEFLWTAFYLHTAFDLLTALKYGTGAVSVYSIVERFFKVNNPYATADGVAALNLATEVSKDGKLDKKDFPAVDKFFNKVK